jgi:lipopolysaccharide biosynthesis glycosyltransferase
MHVTVGSFGIAAEAQVRVRASVDPLPVEFVPLEAQIPLDIPTSAHINRTAYGRTKIFDFLPPEVRRAVFLDSDVIVRDNLEFLFSFDLGDAPVAAVQTAIVSQGLPQWRLLGLSPTTAYMNTGVLVVDVDAWRARDIGNAVLTFAFEHGETLRWADQDGFNAVLAGDFARLPLRWNQESALRRPTHSGYALFAANEVDEAIENPGIVHFSGMNKPWHADCTDSAAADWLRILENTEYRDYEPPREARSAATGRFLRLRRRALSMTRRMLRL